ncbi:MAG: beta-glucoside-specific PTS transporter subunit IIABC [Erysipelotrichaceae bacterium]
MNYQELGSTILNLVGGKDNVSGLTHCATRLRFNLVDESKANKTSLENTVGVLGVVQNAGQYQIIIGNDVNHVYKPIAEVCKLDNKETNEDDGKSLGMKLIDTITGIFTPILPAITAAGMLKAVLALAIAFKWTTTASQTYQIINFMADAAFYFLPILLANSAAKKFNCNPYLAMMLGGVLLHPTFVAMVNTAKETGEAIQFGMIPIYNAGYSSSVIPIILIVWLMSYVEPFADRISPKAIKFFTKPMITIFVVGLAGLTVLGPIGYIISSWIALFVNTLNTYVSWLVPMILGGTFPLLVMTGTHYGIIPIGINNRMTAGFDSIVYPANLASNIAQGAATFAVAFKTKSSEIKEVAISSGITAVCGITEPALYGINMKYKTPLISACTGGAIGGLFMGIMQVKNYAGGSPGLLTLPGYLGGDGFSDILFACIGALIAFVVSFIMSYVLYKEETPETNQVKTVVEKPVVDLSKAVASIAAPVDGVCVALSEVNDPTFAQAIMGKGMAIAPTSGTFTSPVNGTVLMVFDTKHAIGFLSDDGVEVLLHVGLNTVNLGGQHFEALVKVGDKVKVGTPILNVDLAAIQAKGYETITPVIVTNTLDFADVIGIEAGQITAGESVVKTIR